MPTYEYRCPACSHRFELRQSFQDPPLAQCPKCAGSARRIISRSKSEGLEVRTVVRADLRPSGVIRSSSKRPRRDALVVFGRRDN